jgi:hypothetical protein
MKRFGKRMHTEQNRKRKTFERRARPGHEVLKFEPLEVSTRCRLLASLTASFLIAGCAGEETPVVDTAALAELTRADSVAAIVRSLPARHSKPRKLAPLADTIAQRLVFQPTTQTWFVGAVRDKRFGIDVGRIDIDLQKPPGRLAAFKEAAEATSPYEIGTLLRVRGPWGEDDAKITGFDAVGSRIVARVALAAVAESSLVATPELVMTAQRVASASPSATTACDRAVDPEFARRLTRAADSLLTALRAGEQPAFTRLQRSMRSRKSTVTGCFGNGKGIAIASISAGDYEWVRERAILMSETSRKALLVRDLRFRSHEALHAFDGDGDGVDDVAARAWTTRAGTGLVVMRLADSTRLERLAAGFAVER